MTHRRALLAGLVATPVLAHAQAGYPSQTIRVTVAFIPGGTTDIIGRLVAEALAERLPRPVVVDNRGGANGIIGTEAVLRAAPDGHTLLLCSSAQAVLGALFPNLTWDPIEDFTPILPVAATPYMLVVHPDLPVRSLAELVALAKAQPGKLTFASSGMGSAQHLAGEQLKRLAGIDLLHVPYRGSGAIRADLLTNRVNLMFENVALTVGMVQRGEVRGIAVTSRERTALVPELPTLTELGYAGAEIEGWFGLLGPAGMPPGIVATLGAAVNDWLRSPAAIQKLAGLGARVLGGPPEDLTGIIGRERQRWGGIIRDANIRPE